MRLIAVMALVLFSGCAWSVKSPPRPTDAAPIYLTDYGRHTSVIMPVNDRHMVEYAYGDWDWFAVGQNSSFSAVRALLFSQGSTLGRRWFVNIDDLDELKRLSGADRVVRLRVPRQRIPRLVEQLDREYTKHIDTIHFNPITHLDHVRSDRHYSAFDNCNNMTARWLRALGCDIGGWTIWSNFTLKDPPYLREEAASGPANMTSPSASAR